MKNKQIEAIRGIFVIMVVCYHVFVRYIQLYVSTGKRFGIFDYFGSMGVIVFLLISTYFLISEEKGEVKFSLISFYIRKFMRLWPMYAVSILLIFLVTHAMNSPEDRLVGIKELVLNLLFINGFTGVAFVDGAHWYMTTLIKFIMTVGIIKKLRLENKGYTYIFWILGAMALKIFNIAILYTIFGGPYVGIVGIAATLKYGVVDKNAPTKEKMIWLIPSLLGIIYLYIFNNWTVVVEVVLASFILYLAIHCDIKIFDSKLLVFIGSISYPLYLIHQNISYGVINLMTDSTGAYNMFYSVLALVMSVVLAILLHHIIDKNIESRKTS